ncbi:MAG: tRNA (N6-isopentenyl adenosine(37)-C2)-methylthiotransferase MiaB, partial [Clostridiales bacterium]|nr:tRNA (N6-isopentenyl adenosine(37)-C2)-methylthiotransferase MiaB [Clostridiales bacterium]
MDYIERVKEHKCGGKYMCKTYGCQMNAHDSEKLSFMLEKMGFEKCESESDADIIIFNTCCVRENAENRVFGNLGFLKNIKKNKKDFKIALCGCMTQQGTIIEKIKQSYGFVDIIFGTFNLAEFPRLLFQSYKTGEQIIDIWEKHEGIDELDYVPERRFQADVNIMYGCNNFCSYCIVPYVRGRERSRPVGDIIREIEKLADSGIKEVTLLGQNVNSYGNNLDDDGKKVSFPELLSIVNEIDGIERIRFMTSHPKDVSDELIQALTLKKVCKHFHLPVQSGSDKILAAMNRKYTKNHYLGLAAKIKKTVPNIALTTDIIIGFPGETEQDFLDTLDVVKTVRFNGAFTFYYSPRTGTPAASMPEQVSADAAKERFEKLLEAVNEIAFEINKSYENKVFDVLVESEKNGIL